MMERYEMKTPLRRECYCGTPKKDFIVGEDADADDPYCEYQCPTCGVEFYGYELSEEQ